MNNKRIILALSIALLSGCAEMLTFKNPPINDPSDDATIKLAEAANSVSDSMMEMAKVEKIIIAPEKTRLLKIPSAINLQARASIDWSGPIEELVSRVAHAAHYRLRVLGKEPSVPVLIGLRVKDESLAEILRNIDFQAGKRADIYVYPNSQIVELRYAKIYS